jgi:hypothetical protein
MDLLFWICTILLALSVVGGLANKSWPYWASATGVLVIIDLIILGIKSIGLPH